MVYEMVVIMLSLSNGMDRGVQIDSENFMCNHESIHRKVYASDASQIYDIDFISLLPRDKSISFFRFEFKRSQFVR